MANVQFVHINDLDMTEKSKLIKLSEEYNNKIEREVGDVNLVINIKKRNKGGRSNYEIILKVEHANFSFASLSNDWDFPKAVHRAFEKVLKEIQHRYKE